MNDDQIVAPQPQQPAPVALSPQPVVNANPVVDTQPVVDDLFEQGKAIQDLFAQNDVVTQNDPVAPVAVDQPIMTDPAQQIVPPTPQVPVNDDVTTDNPTPDPSSQKSPLDILEEILSKEEHKQAEAPPAEQGPSPEELQRIAQLQAQEQQLIEAQRQKMQAEMGSDEQKQRDVIRQQQTDANKVVNPFEIIQLERKKIVR